MDFVLIINGVEKTDISETLIYQFFDNATVSVLLGVLVASIIAIWQYKKQKEIDRLELQKKEIMEELILLQSTVRQIELIYGKCSNTIKAVKEGTLPKMTKKDNKAFNEEVSKVSEILNDKIPFICSAKIDTLVNLYFSNKEIKNLYKDLLQEVKNFQGELSDPKIGHSYFLGDLKANPENLEKLINKLIDKIYKLKK